MVTFLVLFAVLVCVLLILIILIQNPKGGGLASNFSSSNNIMGVQRTGDILEKGSWGLAITIMVLAVLINISASNNVGKAGNTDSKIQEQIDKTAAPSSIPGFQKNNADTTKK